MASRIGVGSSRSAGHVVGDHEPVRSTVPRPDDQPGYDVSVPECCRYIALWQQEVHMDAASESDKGQPTIGGRKPSLGLPLLQLPTGSGTRARSLVRIPSPHRRLLPINSRPTCLVAGVTESPC